jgi:hypothetical protein
MTSNRRDFLLSAGAAAMAGSLDRAYGQNAAKVLIPHAIEPRTTLEAAVRCSLA